MGARRWTNMASGLKVTVQTEGVLFARVSSDKLGFQAIWMPGLNLLSVFYCWPSGIGGTGGYIFVGEAKSWGDAQIHCRNLLSDLVSVRSAEKNEAVLRALASQSVWIGLFKDPWKWSDGSPTSFRYWKPLQPNYRQGQDCVAAVIADQGKWNDLRCGTRRYFVCRGGTFLFTRPWICKISDFTGSIFVSFQQQGNTWQPPPPVQLAPRSPSERPWTALRTPQRVNYRPVLLSRQPSASSRQMSPMVQGVHRALKWTTQLRHYWQQHSYLLNQQVVSSAVTTARPLINSVRSNESLIIKFSSKISLLSFST